jgi:hypothetical protein
MRILSSDEGVFRRVYTVSGKENASKQEIEHDKSIPDSASHLNLVSRMGVGRSADRDRAQASITA